LYVYATAHTYTTGTVAEVDYHIGTTQKLSLSEAERPVNVSFNNICQLQCAHWLRYAVDSSCIDISLRQTVPAVDHSLREKVETTVKMTTFFH